MEGTTSTAEAQAPLIMYEKNGQPVYVPPHIADLLRDLPPDKDDPGFDEDGYNEDELLNKDDDGGSLDGVEIMAHGRYRRKSSLAFKSSEETEESWMETMDIDVLGAHLKINFGRLVPFFSTVVLYFSYISSAHEEEEHWTPNLGLLAVAKCLPIICLMGFVLLHGTTKEYNQRIFFGLLFCCGGDSLLIWEEYFLQGVVAFAFAHIFYIRAFELYPMDFFLGTLTLGIGSSVLYIESHALETQPTPIYYGVMAYSCLIMFMLWRAGCRIKENFSWSSTCGLIGAMAFVLSDILLAVNRFIVPFPYAEIAIMIPYYTAQFMITVSIITPSELPPTETNKNENLVNG